tara:strand:+ start:97 stop:519 length:423 start_codon:yes stop_codon:yes gene_type:complete
MKKLITTDKQKRFAVSVAAIIVACFIGFLIHITNTSFALPEPIAQSQIWFWISYPYHFLINILPKDNFIFNSISVENLSFLIVVFVYFFILYALIPESKRGDNPPIIVRFIALPLALSFIFLFGFLFVVLPIDLLISLFT